MLSRLSFFLSFRTPGSIYINTKQHSGKNHLGSKGAWSGPCLRGKEGGQMHVMEVMIGGLLILGALQAGIAMTHPSEQQESGTTELRSLGTDAMRTLFYLPIANETVDPGDFANSTSYIR